MKRKFTIIIEVIDNEAPGETNEQAAGALKDYIKDAMSDLAFDIQNIQVTCE